MKKIIVISIFVSFILSCDPICEYNIVFKNSSSKKASVYKNISSQSYSVDIVPNDQKLMKKLNSDIGCKMYYEIFDTVKIDFSDGKKIIYPQEEQLVALPSDNFYYNSKENKYYVERNGVIMHEFNSKIGSTYVYKNLGDSTFLKDTNTYDFNSYKVIKEKRKEYTYLYTITENDYLKAK